MPKAPRSAVALAATLALSTGSGNAQDPNWIRKPGPAPQHINLATAYDAGRDRVVLFGGGAENLETWEWDGSVWVQLEPSVSPGAAADVVMVYDAARQTVVAMRGDPAETWLWDGREWLLVSLLSVPPAPTVAAYDSARQVVVVLANNTETGSAETWEWDGVAWVNRSPVLQPLPRNRAAMAYDAQRQRTVLFGGRQPSGCLLYTSPSPRDPE